MSCPCLTKCLHVGLSVGTPSQVTKNKENGAFLEQCYLSKDSGKSTLKTDCISKDFSVMIISPSMRVFSSESVLCIMWPKYWHFSFSITPSNEHSGLISFSPDGLVGSPCCPRDFEEFSPTPQFRSITSSVLSFL